MSTLFRDVKSFEKEFPYAILEKLKNLTPNLISSTEDVWSDDEISEFGKFCLLFLLPNAHYNSPNLRMLGMEMQQQPHDGLLEGTTMRGGYEITVSCL